MSVKAKLYVAFIVLAGAAVLFGHLSRWESHDPLRYLTYMALAVAASRLKVSLPFIAGGMSVFFVYVLFAIMEFSLPETLFLGCIATLFQSFS